MSFLFETRDVPVAATTFVRDLLAEGRGGCVYGAPGTGKSHAVRAAVQGGLRVDVTPGPLLGLRFMADLARQLGRDGRPVLEAVRHEGVKAALRVAEPVVNGHPLVVDEAHLLLGVPASLEDPATALWQEEKAVVLGWLRERATRTPTVLVGQRCVPEVARSLRHLSPRSWPLMLKQAPDGFREWQRLGKLARGVPAALTLAAALVPWLSATDFNGLVEQAEADDISERELLGRLGGTFQASVPPAWQQVLALLAALGAIPREPLAAVLDEQALSALAPLVSLGLVETGPEGLTVLPALIAAAALRPLTAQERTELLPAVAHRLLAPINDLRSLDPEHADRVLRAHAIFVDLGDMANAERTAALHVHGLVDLARRTSREKDYPKAWQQYDGLWRLLQSGTFGTADETGRHLLSYVRHYRAWNGQRAGALDDGACLEEYQASLAQWPTNALWHQRTLEGMIRLGRLTEARQALASAYQEVPLHPRRDELLRVRPARTAMSEGEPIFSLELLEPVLEAPAELYPGVAEERDDLLGRWAQGISLAELSYRPAWGNTLLSPHLEGRVVFRRDAKVSLHRTAAAWVARLPELAAEGRANSALAALEALAGSVGQDAWSLISRPSSGLSDRDVRRKGHFLSLVDALNSDIGLEHADARWLVGRVEGERFIPVMRDLPAADLPAALRPESTAGLYFARVPVHRDGQPRGPVEELKPAGSGRTLDDLRALLVQMSGGSAERDSA